MTKGKDKEAGLLMRNINCYKLTGTKVLVLVSVNVASASEDFHEFKIDGRTVIELPVYQMKSRLRSRGINVTGLKKELQEKLCRV